MNGGGQSAFQLASPPSGHQEQDFLAAWKEGIKACGHPVYFGTELDRVDRYLKKEPLAPRTKLINSKILELPISQAALIVAMVGFYNPAEGHRLQAKLNIKSIANLASALNPRKQAT